MVFATLTPYMKDSLVIFPLQNARLLPRAEVIPSITYSVVALTCGIASLSIRRAVYVPYAFCEGAIKLNKSWKWPTY